MQTLILSPTTPHAGASVSTNGRYHELTFWLDYMADNAFEVNDNSRLSCQIILEESMNGLRVTLAPGSEP